MPKGAALSQGSSGENVQHFGAIRISVRGSGELRMTAYSMDDVRSKTLVPFTMQTNARYPPTRIVNFTETRASFEIGTTAINEHMRINRITVFMKEVATSYPGS